MFKRDTLKNNKKKACKRTDRSCVSTHEEEKKEGRKIYQFKTFDKKIYMRYYFCVKK